MRLELATEIARLAAPIYAALLQAEATTTATFALSSAWRRGAMQTAVHHACELRRVALETKDG